MLMSWVLSVLVDVNFVNILKLSFQNYEESIKRDWVVIEIILEYVTINIKVLEERHSVDDKKKVQVTSSLSL